MANQYQSFEDGDGGASESNKKLACLKLPSLVGKSVLDIGCNEGFFCFKAKQLGADYVLGVDHNPDFLERAQFRSENENLGVHNSPEFQLATFDTLPGRKFDVVLFLSAIHYAEDQAKLIHNILNNLVADNGVLILELGVLIDREDEEFVKVVRSIDERFFPTFGLLKNILKNYAYKLIGPSVSQAGDPVPRWVLHIKKLKQIVLLVTGSSGAGKTTLNRLFVKNSIPCISIDDVLTRIVLGDLVINSQYFQNFIRENYNGLALDILYESILNSPYFEELIIVLIDIIASNECEIISIEGYLLNHINFRSKFTVSLLDAGKYVWYVNR